MFTRRFGAELEYSEDALEDREHLCALVRSGIEKFSDHPISMAETPDEWTSKEDSSCGFELTTPCLEYTRANIDMVCRVLRSFHTRVKRNAFLQPNMINRYCGFHVHIDTIEMEEPAWVRFFQIWRRLESPILSILPKCRRHNGDVILLQDGYLHDGLLRDLIEYPTDKFYAVHRIHDKNRIEVRYAQSTLDVEDFFQWMTLVRILTEIAEKYATEDFRQYPHDFRGRIEAQILVDFLRTHKSWNDAPWIKHNFTSMIKWIGKKYKRHYKRDLES